jgi:hypothetical protein
MKKNRKLDLKKIFLERRKNRKGFLRDYDFIISKNLKNFENIKFLIEKSDGQVIRLFNKFDKEGISKLVEFLHVVSHQENSQVMNTINGSQNKSKTKKGKRKKRNTKLEFQSLPQTFLEAPKNNKKEITRPIVIVYRQTSLNRKLKNLLLTQNLLKMVILCQEDLLVTSMEEQNLLFLNMINFRR